MSNKTNNLNQTLKSIDFKGCSKWGMLIKQIEAAMKEGMFNHLVESSKPIEEYKLKYANQWTQNKAK